MRTSEGEWFRTQRYTARATRSGPAHLSHMASNVCTADDVLLEIRQLVEKGFTPSNTALSAAVSGHIASKVARLTTLSALKAIEIANAAEGLGERAKTDITNAVNTALTTGTVAPTHTKQKGGSTQQRMDEPLQLFRVDVMETLCDPKTTSLEAEERLAAHIRNLGCLEPDEQTRGACAAILTYAAVQRTGRMPSYLDIYNCVQSFGAVVASIRGKVVRGPREYPSSVDELPGEIRNQAFGDQPPKAYDLPRVRQICKCHVPIRWTSKLLLPYRDKSIGSGRGRESRSRVDDASDASPVIRVTTRHRAALTDSRGRNNREPPRHSHSPQRHSSSRRRRSRSRRRYSRSRSYRRGRSRMHSQLALEDGPGGNASMSRNSRGLSPPRHRDVAAESANRMTGVAALAASANRAVSHAQLEDVKLEDVKLEEGVDDDRDGSEAKVATAAEAERLEKESILALMARDKLKKEKAAQDKALKKEQEKQEKAGKSKKAAELAKKAVPATKGKGKGKKKAATSAPHDATAKAFPAEEAPEPLDLADVNRLMIKKNAKTCPSANAFATRLYTATDKAMPKGTPMALRKATRSSYERAGRKFWNTTAKP